MQSPDQLPMGIHVERRNISIPKFYRWISERYPLINQTITGRVTPEFDNLYIDLNLIIDRCCQQSSLDSHTRLSSTQIMYSIFREICNIVQLVKPKKILYLSLDGVSPNAKYNHLRQQHFLHTFNNSDSHALDEKTNIDDDGKQTNADDLRSRIYDDNEDHIDFDEIPFDKNCVLPGTVWMDRFNKEIELFIRRQVTENTIWRRLTIIYDDYLSPGEASHKIMSWIRREKSSNDCDPNIRHCLYGLDTKYFVMALVLHEINFCLLYDQLLFGTEYKDRLYSNSRCIIDNDQSFQLVHICILREYLSIEFNTRHRPKLNVDNIIDDVVLLIVLYENEYLPPIPSLDMEVLLETYKQILHELPSVTYLVNEGVINFPLLYTLLLTLSNQEYELLANVYEVLLRYYQRLSGYRYDKSQKQQQQQEQMLDHVHKRLMKEKASSSQPENTKMSKKRKIKVSVQIERVIQTLTKQESVTELIENTLTAHNKKQNKETTEQEEEVEPVINKECCMNINELKQNLESLRNTKENHLNRDYVERYYHERFGIRYKEKDEIFRICHDYLKTIEWVMHYYYFGCISWGWCYRYYYAPLIGDFLYILSGDINSKYDNNFNLGAPLTPFDQLIAVLPSECHLSLLPEYCMQFINDERFKAYKNNILCPRQYFIDTNYHLVLNNHMPLLPFIDMRTFRSLLYQIEMHKKHRLCKLPMTVQEQKRNTLLNGRIFRYDREKATEKLRLDGPLAFGSFPDVVSCIRNKGNDELLLHRQYKFIPRPLKGARFNIPGFPKLKHFNFTPAIKQIGLKAFGLESQYKTLILASTHTQNQYGLTPVEVEQTAQLIAEKPSVFIDWPYFIEAKVAYVETRSYIYEQYNFNKVEHTDREMFHFDQRCLKISENLLKLKGIDVGVINCLVHCYPLVSMHRQENRMKIVKRFNSEIYSFPVQMVWTQDQLTNFDTRFMDQKIDKKLELRMGAIVMYVGNERSLLGSIGKITSQTRNGTINIRVLPHLIQSKIPKIYEIIQKHEYQTPEQEQRWYSLAEAAELLNVQKIVIKRILEHIFVIHGTEKIQIGLRLFNFKRKLVVPQYTRIAKKYADSMSVSASSLHGDGSNKDNKNDMDMKPNERMHGRDDYKRRRGKRRKPRYVFEISHKALQIVSEYRSKFPGVFRVIQQKPSLVTFGSHYFAPDQIPTNFNPYIVSRVVGVSPSGLSSNFQDILDSVIIGNDDDGRDLNAVEDATSNINLENKPGLSSASTTSESNNDDDDDEAADQNEDVADEDEKKHDDADGGKSPSSSLSKKADADTPMSRLFSPRKARFPHDLDNPAASNNNSGFYKWKPDMATTDPLPISTGQQEEKVDASILSIRDAFKAKIHAAAAKNAELYKSDSSDDAEEDNNDNNPDDAEEDDLSKHLKIGGLSSDDMGLRYVLQVEGWLDQLGMNKLALIDANSLVVPVEAIKEIEDEVDRLYEQRQYHHSKNHVVRLEKVPIHHVYASDPTVAWSPTPRRLWKLGDRCCSLRSDLSVPFGCVGTVIGIHVNFLEILCDKPSVCGTTLCHKATSLKGIILPYDSAVNISTSFHSYTPHDLVPIDQFPKHKVSSSYINYSMSSSSRYRPRNNMRDRHHNDRRRDQYYNNNKMKSSGSNMHDKRGKAYHSNRNRHSHDKGNNNDRNRMNRHQYVHHYSRYDRSGNMLKYQYKQTRSGTDRAPQHQQILATDNRNRHRTSPVYGPMSLPNNNNHTQHRWNAVNQSSPMHRPMMHPPPPPQQQQHQQSRRQRPADNPLMQLQQLQHFLMSQGQYMPPDSFLSNDFNPTH